MGIRYWVCMSCSHVTESFPNEPTYCPHKQYIENHGPTEWCEEHKLVAALEESRTLVTELRQKVAKLEQNWHEERLAAAAHACTHDESDAKIMRLESALTTAKAKVERLTKEHDQALSELAKRWILRWNVRPPACPVKP